MSRLGKIPVQVPQVREGVSFYPSSLEKGIRSEGALKLAIAERYVKGVATRKVSAIVEELCGTEVSSTQGSEAAKELDAEIAAWRTSQAQNAMSHVPKVSMRPEVASDIRSVLNAPDRQEADRVLNIRIEKYRNSAPDRATWLEEKVPQSLTVFQAPAAHRRILRTTNLVERLNREIKKRTKIASIFSNPESTLRLVAVMLRETLEQWLNGKRYLPAEQNLS